MSDDLRLLEFEHEGKELSLYIKKASADDLREAETEKALTFQKGIKEGLFLKQEWENVLKSRGLWSDEQENQVKKLQDELSDKLSILEEGGIFIDDAKKLAIEINDLRNNIIILLTDRKNFNVNTADGLAEQAYLDYLIAATTVYNDDRNKKYFKDYKNYLSRKSDNDAFYIARRYAEILYDTIFDESKLPENAFLIEYGFMNENLQFINSDGHLIDSEGNLINENGQRVEIVDGKDIVIGEKKRKPFLDIDGNPID